MWLKLSYSTSFLLLSTQNRKTSVFIKITPLRIVFSSLFSIFDMWWNTVSRVSHPQTREGVFHLLSHRRAFSFIFIVRPTQRCLGMGWNALFSFFFYLPKWLLTRLKKFTENALWKIRFLSGDFFLATRKPHSCWVSLKNDFGNRSFRFELKLFNCTKIPFISTIVWAWTEKNILGEYSSFFELRTWNYLHLNRINLYRNDR